MIKTGDRITLLNKSGKPLGTGYVLSFSEKKAVAVKREGDKWVMISGELTTGEIVQGA